MIDLALKMENTDKEKQIEFLRSYDRIRANKKFVSN